jgi:hypothetical protein
MPNESVLKIIADNKVLLEALKEVFFKQFELKGSVTTTLSNDAIGQVVRARLDGLKLLESGFRELERHKTYVEENKDALSGR